MIARHTGDLARHCRPPRLTGAAPMGVRHDRDRSETAEDAAATDRPGRDSSGALWQKEINVRAFIQLNYTPYDGDAAFLAPATARTKRDLGEADAALRRGAKEGRARHLADPELDHGARAGLHRQGERDHRRAPDRGAAQARHHAERRFPHGAQCASRPTATRPTRTSSRRSPSTARPTTRASSTPIPPTSAAAAARTC